MNIFSPDPRWPQLYDEISVSYIFLQTCHIGSSKTTTVVGIYFS